MSFSGRFGTFREGCRPVCGEADGGVQTSKCIQYPERWTYDLCRCAAPQSGEFPVGDERKGLTAVGQFLDPLIVASEIRKESGRRVAYLAAAKVSPRATIPWGFTVLSS